MSQANRGKTAESLVQRFLKDLSSKAHCSSFRLPDARAGSLVTAPADFLICRNGKLTLLEVKEVAHEYRLPQKNFALDQRARMKMWKLAGAQAFVLVCFQPSRLWRLADIDYFTDKGPSWDMRDVEIGSLADLERFL